jgi:hypothetical protein
MTNHPITPPPELVEQWYDACILEGAITYDEHRFAAFAAQWGADQELEKCVQYLLCDAPLFVTPDERVDCVSGLRKTRRPKPPSLKEQALALLQPGEPRLFNSEMQDTIRRALEQLPE